jgi:hypothetical protein
VIFERELINLILYAAQQLGIVLAVGGQTIVLVAYLLAMRDRVIDSQEAQFARAVRTVLVAGLGLIILSGLGITALHYSAGEMATLLSPPYLFKWMLIGAVGLFTLGIGKGALPQWIGEAFAGGTWYALFLLHILAPMTTWGNLIILYGGWLAAFSLCWGALVFGTRDRAAAVSSVKKEQPQKPVIKSAPAPTVVPNIPSAKVQPPPAPPLKAAVPPHHPMGEAKPPAPAEVVLTPPKIISAPISAPTPTPGLSLSDHPNLPAIRVMPKGPHELK